MQKSQDFNHVQNIQYNKQTKQMFTNAYFLKYEKYNYCSCDLSHAG